jgi:hypothetical protein
MRAAAIALLSAVLAAPSLAQSATPATAPASPAAPPAATPVAPPAGPERITGTIAAFAAPELTVKTAKGLSVIVILPAGAKIIANERSSFNAIKSNDFVSLTAAADKDGKLKAKEVRVFPEAMRGFGEGQYPGDKAELTRINATVTEAATVVRGKGGFLKLTFHAAAANPLGVCAGHAPAPATGACTGQADVAVTPATPVTAWVLGDTSWLETGKAVSLYAVTGPDGKTSSYGVIVERNGVKPAP